MNIRLKAALATTVLGALGATFAGHAQAGCGFPDGSMAATFELPQASANAKAALLAADPMNIPPGQAGITGLWHFTFLSQGNPGIPDGMPLDAGFATWHADGTEIMNSSRPPMTSSFCMGVWTPLKHDAYRLNHYALSWDPSGSVFIGPTNIREQVTLARDGNSYAGTFSIIQYAPDGTTQLGGVQGSVSATRITP